jgi:hypothetical protein
VSRKITSHGLLVPRLAQNLWAIDADACYEVEVKSTAANDWTQSYVLKVRDVDGAPVTLQKNSGSWDVPRGSTATWCSSIDLTVSGIAPGHKYQSVAQLKLVEKNPGTGELGWDAQEDSPDGYRSKNTNAGT